MTAPPHPTPDSPTADRTRRASRRRRRVAAVAAAVLGATGFGLVGGAGSAHAAATPDICPPHLSKTQPGVAASAMPGGADLVEWFAKAAGGAVGGGAFRFVMSQLGQGDPTPGQLQEILAQLASMDARLDALQSSVDEISRRVNHGMFTTLMIEFNKYKSKVEAVNENGLQEVSLAVANLAKIKSSPGSTPEQIAQARACLDQKKAFFKTFATHENVATNLKNISNLLPSSVGEEQLVNSYGRQVVQNNRYLTTKHSEILRAFYDYLEQYQALAAIQLAEWQLASQISTARVKATNVKFYNTDPKKPGLIQSQRAALPRSIPAGVVIDVGPAGDTTLHKPMLFPYGGSDGNRRTTWRDEDKQRWSTGRGEAVRVASAFVYPNAGLKRSENDWRVIDKAGWNSLVAGKKPEQTGTEYLNALFGLVEPPGRRNTDFAYAFGAKSAVWVDTVKYHQIRVWSRGDTVSFPVHPGIQVGQSGALAIPAPATVMVWTPWLPDHGPKSWNSRNTRGDVRAAQNEALKKEVAQIFDTGLGSLILSRETNVNYMATTR